MSGSPSQGRAVGGAAGGAKIRAEGVATDPTVRHADGRIDRTAASTTELRQPLPLRCGQILPNRLAKAAMTERLSGTDYAPNALHEALYRRWAAPLPGDSGAAIGLQITGNMLVDPRNMESGGNIVPLWQGAAPLQDPASARLAREGMQAALKRMAIAAKSGGARAWVQLSQAGRQCSRFNTARPVAPSAVGLSKLGLFARPRALRSEELPRIVEAFAHTARIVVDAGFDGVQVHAAHGYLLSQFLSPITNRRTDAYGGALENRARLLLDIVDAVREAIGPGRALAVKLNSADFQRGGFAEGEAMQVAGWLDAAGIDLLEISGGSYERLAFFDGKAKGGADAPVRASSRAREAYFMAFAEQLRQQVSVPLMLTGGFRTAEGMGHALRSGAVDVVGVARPMLLDPAWGAKALAGQAPALDMPRIRVGLRQADDLAEAGYWDHQVERVARGLDPVPDFGSWAGLMHITKREAGKGLAKRFARKRNMPWPPER